MIGVADRQGRHVCLCASLPNEQKTMHKLFAYIYAYTYTPAQSNIRGVRQEGEDLLWKENGHSNVYVGLILFDPHTIPFIDILIFCILYYSIT